MFKLNIRNKLIFFISLVVFVLGYFCYLFGFTHVKSIFLANEKNSLSLQAAKQTQETEQVFKHASLLAKNIAEQDFVIDYLESLEDEEIQQDNNIMDRLESFDIAGMYPSIYLIDKNGRVLASTDETIIGYDYASNDYSKEALSGNPYIDFSVAAKDRQLAYYFSYPVQNNRGSILGALVLKMMPDFVNNTIKLSQDQKGITTMIIDDYGVVVHSSNENRLYKSLGTLSGSERFEIDTKKRYEGIDLPSLGYDAAWDNLLVIENMSIFDFFDEQGKQKSILSAVKMNDLPFFMVFEKDMSVFNQSALKVSLFLTVSVIAFLALISLIIIFLLNKFLKPLADLNQAVKNAIISGNINERIDIEGSDEVGDLATNFNRLMSKLQKLLETVETKVTQRTHQLEEVNKELEKVNREKTEFVSMASHQLRTPLTTIQWVVERLLKVSENLSEKEKEYVEDINKSSTRLVQLIDDLLNISRIEGGRISVSPQKYDMVNIIKDYIDESFPLSEQKEIKIIFKDHPKSLNVLIDKAVVQNVLQTLISNAMEYTPKGGLVEISLSKEDGSFLVKIRDTGIGIPTKDQPIIFEKFTRGANVKLLKKDGTGLGLYIAKQIMHLLGGKIWFESIEKKGTTFFVEFPLELEEVDGKKSVV